MLKTDERRSGSIDGKAHRVHHLQQGGADDVVTELLIAALTASAHGKRPSPMQLAGFCSYQSDCMSLRAHRHLPCALCCRHACLVLKTDERRSGSIDGEAHRMHHLQQGGADDVTELLIAALTASAHGNRPWQRAKTCCDMPCGASQSCCW